MIAYLVTNQANGKQYIGVTSSALSRRWRDHLSKARRGSRTALHAAIRKYGEDQFVIRVIASVSSKQEAGNLEVQLIKEYSTKVPHGYNITDGGDGVIGLPPEMLERIAQQNRGRKHTEDAKRRIGIGAKGRVVAQSAREKIGNARRGKPLSAEHKAKLAAAKQGKRLPPRTDQHRQKIAEGLKQAHAKRPGPSWRLEPSSRKSPRRSSGRQPKQRG